MRDMAIAKESLSESLAAAGPVCTEQRSRRDLRRKFTRAAILDAGREVFLELGFEACSIRDIIRRSGLAAGTFYNYFDTKEAVLQELIGDEIQRLMERMHESRRKAKSLHAFVLGAYREVFRAIITKPDVFQIILRNESVVRRMYSETGFDSATEALRRDMRRARRHGILPDLNVDWLASVFFGAAYEIGRNLLEAEDATIADAEAAAEFTARLFLGGIQAFSSQDKRSLKLRMRAALKS